MRSHFLAFVVLILVADGVKALRCYQCDYFEEGVNYDDKIFEETCKSKFVVECPIISDVCFKVSAQGQDEQGKNVSYVIRGCGMRAHFPGYEDEDTEKCEDKDSTELSGLVGHELPENFNGTLCLCRGDRCNSSSMLKVTQIIFLSVIGILGLEFINLLVMIL